MVSMIDKGVLYGGLTKNLSPIKTRSSKNELVDQDSQSPLKNKVIDEPRVLRDQKSLVRGKK